MDNSANNKRIAKNTLLLYFRMIVLMLVSLYTSRVILDALGETDYGIYNVVGSVVAMFTMLSGSLSGAISRFITYELGKGDKEKLRRIFSTSVNIQILMSLLLILICEIVGVWFLNTKMNIPADRMEAANWILQLSIATFVVGMISLPYNAAIVAHERMGVFAYIGILEASLKLLVAFLIYVSPIDKLVLYGLLILVVSIILRMIYGIYCSRHFEEAKYQLVLDKGLLKEMVSFASWNLFGSTAYMLNTQGVNMLINVFFGVSTNAARAIAVQVESAVSQFVSNFMTAINPQIIKSYASGDRDYMVKLVCRSTKYSFFIMYIMTVPICLEADTILSIWLKEVPKDTVIFMQLVMFATLAKLIGNSLYTTTMATGKIRRYQVEVTIVGCLVFPLTWIAYIVGCPAYTTYIIFAVIYFLLNFIRLATLKRLMQFPVMVFNKSVYGRIFPCSVIMFVAPWTITYVMPPSFLRLVLVCMVSVVWSVVCIYYVGLDKQERVFFLSKAKDIVLKKFKQS